MNALANQLRYPNSHTHYFSCVLLFLFAEAQQVGRPSVYLLIDHLQYMCTIFAKHFTIRHVE